jgi:hypothetical protein
VSIKNLSAHIIIGPRMLLCSYGAKSADSWSHQPPSLPHSAPLNPLEVPACMRDPGASELWELTLHPGTTVEPRQTSSQRITRQLRVIGKGDSGKAIIYVRAQVHDSDRGVVTTSNWLRWEMPGR